MHLNFKDFAPEVLKSGFFSTEYEAVQATVTRAGEWLNESGVKVINVETVLLPNVDYAEETTESGIRTSGAHSTRWYQVVRVWYEM